MKKASVSLLVVLSLLLSSCRGKISTGGDDTYLVHTLETTTTESSVNIKGRVATRVTLSEVSQAGFLVSDSESFPDGATLSPAASSIDDEGNFNCTLSIEDLDGQRGVTFYYKAWIERSGKRDYGKPRSFVSPIKEVKSITLTGPSSRMEAGSTVQITAKVLPDDATDKTLFWASSDIKVATVSQTGLVKALSGGSSVISATNGDITGQCTVYVKGEQPAGSVDLGFGPYWRNNNLKPKDLKYNSATDECNYYYPAGNGPWYRWGEVKPLTGSGSFQSLPYDFAKFGSFALLPKEYDAASQELGGTWRLPTYEEFSALFSNCSVSLNGSRTGWYTVKFKSNINSEVLTLECDGYISSSFHSYYGAGKGAYYWSSTTCTDDPNKAYTLMYDYASYVSAKISGESKIMGANIRPVAD